MNDITLYKMHTDTGNYIVNAIDEVEARALMEKNGYYVHYCDTIVIKENEIVNIDMF